MPLELPKSLRKVGGLWQRTSGRGHVYFAGGSRDQKFFAFKNPNAGNGQPDFHFYIEDKTALGSIATAMESNATALKPERRKRKARKRATPAPTPQEQLEAAPFNDQIDDLFNG